MINLQTYKVVIYLDNPKIHAFSISHYATWRNKYDHLHICQTSISQERSELNFKLHKHFKVNKNINLELLQIKTQKGLLLKYYLH